LRVGIQDAQAGKQRNRLQTRHVSANGDLDDHHRSGARAAGIEIVVERSRDRPVHAAGSVELEPPVMRGAAMRGGSFDRNKVCECEVRLLKPASSGAHLYSSGKITSTDSAHPPAQEDESADPAHNRPQHGARPAVPPLPLAGLADRQSEGENRAPSPSKDVDLDTGEKAPDRDRDVAHFIDPSLRSAALGFVLVEPEATLAELRVRIADELDNVPDAFVFYIPVSSSGTGLLNSFDPLDEHVEPDQDKSAQRPEDVLRKPHLIPVGARQEAHIKVGAYDRTGRHHKVVFIQPMSQHQRQQYQLQLQQHQGQLASASGRQRQFELEQEDSHAAPPHAGRGAFHSQAGEVLLGSSASHLDLPGRLAGFDAVGASHGAAKSQSQTDSDGLSDAGVPLPKDAGSPSSRLPGPDRDKERRKRRLRKRKAQLSIERVHSDRSFSDVSRSRDTDRSAGTSRSALVAGSAVAGSGVAGPLRQPGSGGRLPLVSVSSARGRYSPLILSSAQPKTPPIGSGPSALPAFQSQQLNAAARPPSPLNLMLPGSSTPEAISTHVLTSGGSANSSSDLRDLAGRAAGAGVDVARSQGANRGQTPGSPGDLGTVVSDLPAPPVTPGGHEVNKDDILADIADIDKQIARAEQEAASNELGVVGGGGMPSRNMIRTAIAEERETPPVSSTTLSSSDRALPAGARYQPTPSPNTEPNGVPESASQLADDINDFSATLIDRTGGGLGKARLAADRSPSPNLNGSSSLFSASAARITAVQPSTSNPRTPLARPAPSTAGSRSARRRSNPTSTGQPPLGVRSARPGKGDFSSMGTAPLALSRGSSTGQLSAGVNARPGSRHHKPPAGRELRRSRSRDSEPARGDDEDSQARVEEELRQLNQRLRDKAVGLSLDPLQPLANAEVTGPSMSSASASGSASGTGRRSPTRSAAVGTSTSASNTVRSYDGARSTRSAH